MARKPHTPNNARLSQLMRTDHAMGPRLGRPALPAIAAILGAHGGAAFFREAPGAHTFVVGRLDPATGDVSYAPAREADVQGLPNAGLIDVVGRPRKPSTPKPAGPLGRSMTFGSRLKDKLRRRKKT